VQLTKAAAVVVVFATVANTDELTLPRSPPPPFLSQVPRSERELRYRRGLLTLSLSSQSRFIDGPLASHVRALVLRPRQLQTAQTMRTRSLPVTPTRRPSSLVKFLRLFHRPLRARTVMSTLRQEWNGRTASKKAAPIDRPTDRPTDGQPHFGGPCQCFLRIV